MTAGRACDVVDVKQLYMYDNGGAAPPCRAPATTKCKYSATSLFAPPPTASAIRWQHAALPSWRSSGVAFAACTAQSARVEAAWILVG